MGLDPRFMSPWRLLLDAMHIRPTTAEPSDFSILAETAGLPIDREDAHPGLGWDVMLDAFDREGHDEG